MALKLFLDGKKADTNYTHTSQTGGKYFIGEDELTNFYELYADAIIDQEKLYLTEKPSESGLGCLRLDFDFIYDRNVTKHLHTQQQVLKFVKAYIDEIKQYLVVPDSYEIYVMEKRKPTLDAKKDRMKSGIHILVPKIITHKYVEQRVRRTLLPKMPEYFGELLPYLQEDWDKVYDEAVINRSVPWTLYGSRKNDPNSLPYLISYILNQDYDFVMPSAITPELVKKLAPNRDISEETPMTDEGRALYAGIREREVKISGGAGTIPRRGRPSKRSEHGTSRTSSPSGRYITPLDPNRKEYLKSHVMNLNEKRAEGYETWVQVGICLHNIHPDLLDVFLDFSSQDAKYNEADCIQKWSMLTFRNDGEKIGEGSLRYWSREDNKLGYDQIESQNVEKLVSNCLSGTEHDVACVIHAKFRDMYKCSDFGKNVWYRWFGHIWRESDKGINLQLRISKEIAGLFFSKMLDVGNEMKNNESISCSGEGKSDCGECEYCCMNKSREDYGKIYTKLKTTKFKDNVMKECRELFFDEDFTKKVDSNLHLIAFNNGILNLDTFEFRDGKPEDYISFSTNVDYNPNLQHYEHAVWPKVEKFLTQILPDFEVRDYFIKHLATNLYGGNWAQKFHILTGSGSNGKSMLMNLMMNSLGDYACTIPISFLTQKSKSSGSAAPEVARLKGRRFVSTSEPDEAIVLNTSLIKSVSSSEKIYARDLFKSGGEFEIQSKWHLSCNEKPKINSTDGGTWRRPVVINFLMKFVAHPTQPNEYPLDETIETLVKSPEWTTVFMSYLVCMLREGKGLKKLTPPAKVLEYTSEYRNDTDGIAKFMSERLIAWNDNDEPVQIDKTTLKKVFKSWKDDNDQKALSPADLEKRIEAVHGKYMRGGWLNKFKIDV